MCSDHYPSTTAPLEARGNLVAYSRNSVAAYLRYARSDAL